ncbi:hypothetical protein GOB27_27285 [Sinorhizobium meliloti]|nr:hypothetical protein [Sinorhizobium meliloti]
MSEGEEARIPVRHVDRPGYEQVAGAFKSPIIEIGLGFDPQCLSTGYRSAQSKIYRVRALLDTGADEIHVDTSLLDKWGAPKLLTQATIKSVHGIDTVLKRQVHLFVSEASICAEVDVVPTQLSDGTRAYDAIFGMRFLEMGRLVLDVSGSSYFVFHQN